MSKRETTGIRLRRHILDLLLWVRDKIKVKIEIRAIFINIIELGVYNDWESKHL